MTNKSLTAPSELLCFSLKLLMPRCCIWLVPKVRKKDCNRFIFRQQMVYFRPASLCPFPTSSSRRSCPLSVSNRQQNLAELFVLDEYGTTCNTTHNQCRVSILKAPNRSEGDIWKTDSASEPNSSTKCRGGYKLL